jgi:hypothetical protein
MRKHLLVFAALLSLLSPVKAADSTLALLTAAGAVSGADLLYCTQAGADRKCTATQMATYINSLFSGDCTATSGGVLTCAKINGNTFPASGNSGGIPYFSGANAISSSAALTANLPVIGGGAGVAPSVGTRSGNTTAFVTTTGTQTNGDCVKIDASGNHIANGSACGGVSTAIPSVQAGTNYPIVDGDRTKVIYLSNAANQIPTLPSAATLTTSNGWYVTACNIAAGTQTITPTTSTIAGAATYVLPAGSVTAPKCIGIVSDGTNYSIVPDYFRFGANVETAAGLALSAAGGLTTTVASGTSALGTSAIGSAACATAVTTTATNTATTDVVLWGFNGDPTAVTGYVPLVAGMLTIIAYPSANNVNFKVCNNTNASVTPGAITLNWSVRR